MNPAMNAPMNAPMNPEGYDIIGDVHGHLTALEGLVAQMGYSNTDGVWRHPTRQAVFVGDLVDRGAHQVEVVRLAQAMVATGSAQMVIGNHEYNAVAWVTERPDRPGVFCRSHNEGHRKQHIEFLQQVGEGSALHHELLEWFCTLPLWLELSLGGNQLRVVHACWNQPAMDVLTPLLSPTGTLTAEAVVATSVKHSPAYDALEVVLKGPEVELGGPEYVDKGGTARHRARRQWWDSSATTLRTTALIPSGSKTPAGEPFPELPDTPVDLAERYDDQVPVIVGHYWCMPPMELYGPLVACVDYSVARRGPMVAYRWDGEAELTVDHYARFDVVHPDADDAADADLDDAEEG